MVFITLVLSLLALTRDGQAARISVDQHSVSKLQGTASATDAEEAEAVKDVGYDVNKYHQYLQDRRASVGAQKNVNGGKSSVPEPPLATSDSEDDEFLDAASEADSDSDEDEFVDAEAGSDSDAEVESEDTDTEIEAEAEKAGLAAQFIPGVYDLTQDATVRETIGMDSKVVANLQAGAGFEVLKAEFVEGDSRVRAEIKEPHGWITLLDTSDDTHWATNRAAYCASVWLCHSTTICYSTSTECLPQPLDDTSGNSTLPAANPADDFKLGVYDVETDVAITSGSDLESDEIGNLAKGDVMKVLKVQGFASETRVRAQVQTPEGLKGWVSLLDYSNNTRWATDRTEFCASLYCGILLWATDRTECCTMHWDKCSEESGECQAKPMEMTQITTEPENRTSQTVALHDDAEKGLDDTLPPVPESPKAPKTQSAPSTCEFFLCPGGSVLREGVIACGNGQGPACSHKVCCTTDTPTTPTVTTTSTPSGAHRQASMCTMAVLLPLLFRISA